MHSNSELNHVQGFPLLVCILTAVVDSYRPPYGSPTSLSYPHMGVYSCFLGRHTLQRQFLFWELRGLSPNFHIHVSVSDLYIPRIGPHISSRRKGRPIVGIYNSLTDT